VAKHVHIILKVTNKLYHHCIRDTSHNVVMPIFIVSPRSYGPSWERGRGSHTNTSWYYTKIYLVKDQVAPEHIWGLIHQGTRPRINPCFRHGYPGTHPGALDISRDLYQPPRNTSKDQSRLRARIPWSTSRGPRIHLGSLLPSPLLGAHTRVFLLGSRPRTPVIYWGPSQASFAMALTAWSQTKNPRSVLGALVHN
jgi:hypothetical protein